MDARHVTAVILAAGRGTRMGHLCDSRPKCLVEVAGRPILLRQLDALRRLGVGRIIVVVGYLAGHVRMAVAEAGVSDVEFVHNECWADSNYIVSMAKALPLVEGSCLLMHGDVVVSDEVLGRLLAGEPGSRVVVDSSATDAGRDFVARLDGAGRVSAIGVGVTGERVVCSQPVYLLSHTFVWAWLSSIRRALLSGGAERRYAEDFLPLEYEPLLPHDVCGELCAEADTEGDVRRLAPLSELSDALRERVSFAGSLFDVDAVDFGSGTTVVTKREVARLWAVSHGCRVVSDFPTLPTRSGCARIVASEALSGCECLVAVGAGSAIDTAKVVCEMVRSATGRRLRLVALPTLPGSGAEATPFASVWDGGDKSSVYGDMVADLVAYVDAFADTTDACMRQAGLLDICCHAIESSLSVKATHASLAARVLASVGDIAEGYVMCGSHWREAHVASLSSGLCIAADNTGAGHALGYALTSDFGVPHGIASAVCLEAVLAWFGACPDELALLRRVLDLLEVRVPVCSEDVERLAARANAERLSNFSLPLEVFDAASVLRLVASERGMG